jgi:hypothetical protein
VVLASEVLYDCREAQDVAVAALRLMGGGQAPVDAGEVLEIWVAKVFFFVLCVYYIIAMTIGVVIQL